MHPFVDIAGQKSGKLTALKYAGINKYNQRTWICQCECGNIVTKTYTTFINGKGTSCGCARNGNFKHGMCYTRINGIYRKMLERCLSKTNSAFKYYGGRGISICDEWLGKNGFVNFKDWAFANGYSDKLTIDRIDVDGNYEPSNCRWVNRKVQNNNTRRNHYITYNSETHSLKEWSEITGICYGTLLARTNKQHITDACKILSKKGLRNVINR